MSSFPQTPLTLLSQLKSDGEAKLWETSWKRFLEIYHQPLQMAVHAIYRHHTGGAQAPQAFVEDAVASVVADFFRSSRHRYDPAKGRLRSFLRTIVNGRVVDRLRAERPLDQLSLDSAALGQIPDESTLEQDAGNLALLAMLIEELRNVVPHRTFEIFERVKLKSQSPSFVAEHLGVKRAVVDRQVHKAMTALRRMADRAEYLQEFQP